jgi:hypothetical protein
VYLHNENYRNGDDTNLGDYIRQLWGYWDLYYLKGHKKEGQLRLRQRDAPFGIKGIHFTVTNTINKDYCLTLKYFKIILKKYVNI